MTPDKITLGGREIDPADIVSITEVSADDLVVTLRPGARVVERPSPHWDPEGEAAERFRRAVKAAGIEASPDRVP